MKTNDNQHYIYLRSTRERIPCTEQEFHDYYRDINAYRQKQQYHGKCVCPERKRLDCDMDCATRKKTSRIYPEAKPSGR